MVDKLRVKREILALREVCQVVDYDLDSREVILRKIWFPDGWKPRYGDIQFKLGRNYPANQPAAYMSEDLLYNGEVPHIKLNSGPDGWNKHCIHDMADEWVPDRHSMVSMLKLMRKSFRYPNQRQPWQLP